MLVVFHAVFWLLKISRIFCVVLTSLLADWLTIFVSIFVKQVDLDYWGKSGRNSYKSFKLQVCELIFVHNVSITSVTRLTISFQMIYGNNLRGRLGSVLDYVSYINNFVNEKKSSNYKEIGNFSNY